MPNKPREWGNVARGSRDRSAELAVEGIMALKPLLDEKMLTEAERTRRIGKAMMCLQQIARILESVGACTSPVSEL